MAVVVVVVVSGELSRVSSPWSMVLILGSDELWDRALLLQPLKSLCEPGSESCVLSEPPEKARGLESSKF